MRFCNLISFVINEKVVFNERILTMNKTVLMESTNNEKIESVCALEVAFQTMKERCQKLQNRLATVEKENSALRLKSYNQISVPSTENKSVELETIQKLQV